MSRERAVVAALGLALALTAGMAAAVETSAPPRLIRAGPVLELLLPPDFLTSAEVRRHLESGLTTSFQVEATLRLRPRRTARRIVDVRWEPWEERFQVMLRSGAEREESVAGGHEQLVSWWRTRRLRLFADLAVPPGDVLEAELRLTVIPFSSGEEDETRRWLAESVGAEGASASGRVDSVTSGGSRPLRRLLGSLLATSIARDSALEYEWLLDVEARP